MSYIFNKIKSILRKGNIEIARFRKPALSLILKDLNITLVFDVGANIGQFASSIRENGYTNKIISFEPVSFCHKKLISNSSKDSSWVIHNRCALGAHDTSAFINISGNKALSSSLRGMKKAHLESAPQSLFVDKESTKVITLDSIFNKYVGNSDHIFLKIDVQGNEDDVLKGASKSLSKISAIKLELSIVSLYEGDKLYKYYFKKMEELGFQLWDLEPGHRNLTNGKLMQFDAIFVNKSKYR